MGRLIDVGDLHNAVMLNKSDWGVFATPIDQLVESLVSQVSTVEAIPKADYENRLKADLKAILVELQMEIEEMDSGCGWEGYRPTAQVLEVIQQKINELKQEPTTKNDLGVDCVARQDVERFIEGFINEYTPEEELEFINLELDGLKHLPPATPQELKPMVEIDLYSVIKQKYIEREVLDKIRAEIAEYGSIMVAYAITKETKTDKGIEKLVSGVLKQAKEQVLDIIDKYKAETEGT